MKKGKILIIVVLIAVAGALGFYLLKGTGVVDSGLSKQMKLASEEYFKKYISYNESASIYTVTLEMLEEANKNGEKYNLKGLENCDKQKTLSKITINFKDGSPKDTEVELSC